MADRRAASAEIRRLYTVDWAAFGTWCHQRGHVVLPADPATAGDALWQFARLLPERADGGPLAGFLPTIPRDAPARALRCRVAVATTLLAGLELAHDGAVLLEQAADWMPIHVTSRATGEAVAADTVSPA